MTTIRPREDSDLDPCATLLEQVHASDGYPVEGVSDARNFLEDRKILAAWVLTDRAGTIVGHVCINTPTPNDASVSLWREKRGSDDDAVAVLGRLFLHPTARGAGRAEGLVRVAVAWARERGLRLLLFALERIEAPVRFYERIGWENYGMAMHRCADGSEWPAVCFTLPAVAEG